MKKRIFDQNNGNNLDKYFQINNKVKKEELDEDNDNTSEFSFTEIFKDLVNHYTIKGFDKIINEVFNHSHDRTLFHDKELKIIKCFQENLSMKSKQILINIYGRQRKYHRFDKIINGNSTIKDCFKELIDFKIVESNFDAIAFENILELLKNHELNNIAKKFGVKFSQKRRVEMIKSIIKTAENKNQISSFFKVNKASNVSTLKNKMIKEIVDNYLQFTYALDKTTRETFNKIVTLYNVVTLDFGDVNIKHLGDVCNRNLFFLLRIERKELYLPAYQLTRESNIFNNHEELQYYSNLLDTFLNFRYNLENKKLNEAYEIFNTKIKPVYKLEEFKGEDFLSKTLLNRYNLDSLKVMCYSNYVKLLERLHLYVESVEILEKLLYMTRDYSNSKKRGKWYERIAIDYQCHLKNKDKASFWLKLALKDAQIPKYFHLTFLTRLDRLKMVTTDKEPLEESQEEDMVTEDFSVSKIRQLEGIRIDGIVELKTNSTFLWIDEETQQEVYCNVENYVIRYMTGKLEFIQGMHCETSLYLLYYYLLFHDIIYRETVTDTFYSYRQLWPLDLFSCGFKVARQDAINVHLKWLKEEASDECLEKYLEMKWKEHNGESSFVGSWELFENGWGDCLDIFRCIGRDIMLGICEKFLDNLSYWGSGMPDLLVWSCDSKNYELIEVKGPGDKLSDKQRVWIRELEKLGAKVSLCNVKGINRKKI